MTITGLLQVIASVYEIGLYSGIFTVDDVIYWSDKVIEGELPPLIEVDGFLLHR